MAKVKNKKSKKNLSDSYAQRRKDRQQVKKTITPFEVYATKDKKQVLGRQMKNDKGLPGISRTKAIEKRKKTLLVEYKVKDKDNLFLDRRIGEKNAGMSEEDKAMARFAAEKMKTHKKNIYNLNDDEVLTHRGQALIDIEKYDDPRSDEDSDDDDKSGKLDKKFVKEAHFGGGVLAKSEMSRKDQIDQLIAESKMRKAERQMNKEKTLQLTEKLDSDWKTLLPLLASSKRSRDDVVEEETNKIDDYDRALREMKFDAGRARPTDKLKSEEQIAKEKKDELEKLEADRLARMKGFSDEADFQRKHRSADDLDDFHIETIVDDPDEEEENEDEVHGILKNGKQQKEESESDEDGSESEEGSEEEEEESGSEEEEGSEEDEEESEDNLSDLKASESESETEQVKEKVLAKPSKKTDSARKDGKENKVNGTVEHKESDETEEAPNEYTESSVDVKEREAVMEKARKELPYTFKAPESYKELMSLFKNKNPTYQAVIVERIIKCNHYKLSTENKEKMFNLFTYLMQYLDKCAAASSSKELVKFFQIFDRFCPQLYDLRDANIYETKTYLRDLLKEKHDQFESRIKFYPGMDTLILFKLVSNLYTTSDFRHPIVTPCLVFMSQILLRCKIREKSDISKGLYVCTLILEYNVLSKRWSPEAINYLRGVIYVSLPKPLSKLLKVIPPFKQVGETSSILVLEENHKKSDLDPATVKMQVKDFTDEEIDDDFKIRTFVTAINLLCEFLVMCSELDAVYTIFEPILALLTCGSVKRYPRKVRERVQFLVSEIEKLKERKLEYLQFDKKKPKALRMIEPKIEKVYDGKRSVNMSEAQQERQKLLTKIKHETKSAMREIRRDNAFLAKVKLKEQIKADEERKRKVREIFGDAALQQHELKQLKRQKSK